MPKIAFRVSNSKKSGRGHLSRCLAIRKHLKGNVFWFLDQTFRDRDLKLCKNDKFILEDSNHSINNLSNFLKTKNFKIVILDSYLISLKNIEYISNITFTVCICDFGPYPKSNLILNHQPNAKLGKNVLAGPKYAPILYSESDLTINKTIIKKQKIYKHSTNKKNLLISFGTYDSLGIAALVLKSLVESNYFFHKTSIVVLIGKSSPHLNYISRLCKNIENIQVLVEPENLLEIYHCSDLAVGAPGSSLFERLFFGVPSVLVPQNNIHKILTKNWVSKGVVLSAKNDSKSILKNVRLLLENQEECKKMSILGKKIVDGKGAERVSNVIKSIIEV